jgi:tetratricopeptide (TPR) repeat protein
VGCNEEFIQAARNAINNASPFPKLPPGSDNHVDIKFTFDYNVFNGGRNGIFRTIARSALDAKSKQTNWALAEIAGTFQKVPVKVSEQQQKINLSDYLAVMTRKLKHAWHPPKGSVDTDEKIVFNVNHDGTISNLLRYVTGNNPADHAIIEAVLKAAPYAPLPAAAGNTIKTELKIHIYRLAPSAINTVFDLHVLPTVATQGNALSYKLQEAVSHGLSELWSKVPFHVGKNELSLMLSLDEKGHFVNTADRPAIVVYNSSMNSSLDEFAAERVKKLEPFDLRTFNNCAGNYLAKFDFFKHTAEITAVPELDWRPYLANVEWKLRRQRWSPLAFPPGSRAILTCRVDSKSQISDLKLQNAAANLIYGNAARMALNSSAPFWDFPSGAPDQIDMKVTFDDAPTLKQGPPVPEAGNDKAHESTSSPVAQSEPVKSNEPASTPVAQTERAKTNEPARSPVAQSERNETNEPASAPLGPSERDKVNDQVPDAITEYAKSTDADDVAMVHEKLGDVHRIREENNEAIDEYKAITRLRENASIEVKLGQAYEAKGDIESANAAYTRAKEIFPNPPFLKEYFKKGAGGSSWSQNEHSPWPSRHNSYREIIVQGLTTIENHIDSALTLQFEGRYSEARAELEQARNLSPDHKNSVAEKLLQLLPASAARARTYLFMNLAEYEYAQTHYQAAVNAYRKAQKYVLPDETKQQAGILMGMGAAYQAVEDWANAVTSFQKALSIDSSNTGASIGLKSSMAQLKNKAPISAPPRK